MNDWIVTDGSEVVGKYRQHEIPAVPGDLEVVKLSDDDDESLDDFTVSSWWVDG